VRPRLLPDERPLHWVGSSKKDLTVMPPTVVREVGMALSVAQYGGKHLSAKPWKGEGPGVLEIVEDFAGDTYRAVYTVKFQEAVYVLHCFQKKSPTRMRTAQPDVDLIRRRLRAAQADLEKRYGSKKGE
jgi:phage-related protein